MSIQYDCHLHSEFSGDSDTPPEQQIRQAADLGLSGICFTEHEDLDYPPVEGIDFTIDFERYFARLQKLKTAWTGKLQIGIGMEFGMQPHLSRALRDLCRKYPFDFIIVSQHILNGKDPYYPSYYERREEAECYREFLRAQLDNLKAMPLDCFDTLGHMDYVVRYGPNRNLYYSYEKYADVIDPVLNYLIDNGKCLEVNTGGLKYGLGEPNPCIGVLRRYRELGGTKITIGSDAHEPRHLAYDFKKAEAILQDLGYRYYTVFFQRREKQFPL